MIPSFVKPELKFLTAGMCLCGVAAFLISGLVWRFDLSFALGLAFGIVCMLANFVIMGIVSLRATMHSARGAKTIMAISYFCRIAALGLCLYLCFVSPYLNPIAFFITPLFVNISYTAWGIIETLRERRKKPRN
jgi:hypothetical protein